MKKWSVLATTALAACLALSPCAPAQTAADTTPHRIRFIEVEANVALEVLDWGGEGPALVLLTGIGATAHTYDQFAPKLAKDFHVYGITRRGFGASSKPDTGYGIRNLAKDVEKVIETLNLTRPLIVGHSIAGHELDVLGAEYADKIAGLVYLDAAFDNTNKEPDEYAQLLAAVSPAPERPKERPSSYFELSPTQKIGYISRREKPDYAAIKTPTLAIVAVPRDAASLFENYAESDADTRAKMDRIFALDLERVHREEREFTEGVKGSKAMEIVGARHDVYRSNEAEVLKAIVDFGKSNRL